MSVFTNRDMTERSEIMSVEKLQVPSFSHARFQSQDRRTYFADGNLEHKQIVVDQNLFRLIGQSFLLLSIFPSLLHLYNIVTQQ